MSAITIAIGRRNFFFVEGFSGSSAADLLRALVEALDSIAVAGLDKV
jgi:ABC-type ATPase involved in cell division